VNAKRMKFDIRQFGRPLLIVFGVWFVLCVAGYVLLVRPKTAEFSSLVEGSQPQFQVLKQRRAEVEAREGFLEALRQAEADLVHLRSEVLSSRERRQVVVQAEVARLCRLFSIDLDSVSFDNNVLKDEELDRMVMTVPLKGGYNNLRQFLQAVENSDKFLVVDRVALDENKEGGVMLQLSITLATYFDLPAEMKNPTGRTRRVRPRGSA